MQTPTFSQIDVLAAFAGGVLRADTQLVGTGDGQYGYTADEVCHGIYTHKLFEVQGDGIAELIPLRAAKLPALSIYVESAQFGNVAASAGGKTYPVGMICKLGLQYVFEPRAREQETQRFATNFAHTVWYVLCQRLAKEQQNSSSTFRSTYTQIEDLDIGTMRLLPPFDRRLRAFEADLEMTFKRPPWMTGADSDLVVDLASIYADINEKGAAGADALVQLIWSQ